MSVQPKGNNTTLTTVMPHIERAVTDLLRKVEKEQLLEGCEPLVNDRCGENFNPLLYLARHLHRNNPLYLGIPPNGSSKQEEEKSL
jgi:hypothetical protein